MPLQVSCDGRIVSNTVIFEYKEKQRSTVAISPSVDQVKDWFSVSGEYSLYDSKLLKFYQMHVCSSALLSGSYFWQTNL